MHCFLESRSYIHIFFTFESLSIFSFGPSAGSSHVIWCILLSFIKTVSYFMPDFNRCCFAKASKERN